MRVPGVDVVAAAVVVGAAVVAGLLVVSGTVVVAKVVEATVVVTSGDVVGSEPDPDPDPDPPLGSTTLAADINSTKVTPAFTAFRSMVKKFLSHLDWTK